MRDFEKEHNLQKPLSKKEVLKLTPGTWVEVKYIDAPNEIALLLEEPENNKAHETFALFLYFPKEQFAHRRCQNDQIVATHGPLHVPMVGQ